MPCMKRVSRIKKRRYTGQQQGMKSARGPIDILRINRGSTGRFVPPSVYIGFPLSVLAKRRSGQMFSMSWDLKETVVSRANRPIGVPSGPAQPVPPPRRSPPRRDPPVVCPGFGFHKYVMIYIPRHALHEKGLQRRERHRHTGQQPGRKSASRPADKQRINRL